ncbi:hypothetical protein EZ428_19255 [Pedobacter frigiditerrae]|uniref:Uncharacterized protein n=1 Tax=Pedobacter frigiditerrae TaxID=2530452 RepID=A0A4R0MPI8_9SPHI|nr:hypothetical protein [Pedobacter frigiditerrae]TCC88769.1 hypothetical protein EZ428_19255 [Pedobacter frigiditerrae]
MLHSEIQNDHGAIALEEKGYKDIPIVKKVTAEMVEENYKQIKREVFDLLKTECAKQEVKVEVKETRKRVRSRPNKGEGQSVSH